MLDHPDRIDFMGLPLDAVTLDEAVRRVEAMIAQGGPHEQVSLNAQKVVNCVHDEATRRLVRGADLVCADGAGVVLGARLLGQRVPERVSGIELFGALLARAEERGWRPYLLGARAEVLVAAVAAIQARHPRLSIAGWRDGYFSDDEEEAVANAIRDSGAHLLFIAITSPRKEQFLERWAAVMNVPYMQGVGGAFDVVAGRIQRAPAWMQAAHLEWAWRWAQEPRRMWRRNVLGSGEFLARVARARLTGWRVPD